MFWTELTAFLFFIFWPIVVLAIGIFGDLFEKKIKKSLRLRILIFILMAISALVPSGLAYHEISSKSLRLLSEGGGSEYVLESKNDNFSISSSTSSGVITKPPLFSIIQNNGGTSASSTITNDLSVQGQTDLAYATMGNFNFDPDGGIGGGINFPIINSAAGTVNSFPIGFNTTNATTSAMVFKAVSTGLGNINNFTISVGSTSDWAKFSIHTLPFENIDTLFAIASSALAGATTTLYSFDKAGHSYYASSTPPTLSSCGTGPSIEGNDEAGTITAGATASGCILTFTQPYMGKVSCVVSAQTGSVTNALNYSYTLSTLTLTQTGFSGLYDYRCTGLKKQ